MSRLTRRGVLAGGFATLSATLAPSSLSGSSTSSSVSTSGSATITGSGGSGSYAYAWERVSGSTSISALSAASASSGFSTSGLTEGASVSGVWRGKLTDTVTGLFVYTPTTVAISLNRAYNALSASLSPSSLSGSGTGATITTSGSVSVTVSGGSGSFDYAWERVSGSSVPVPTAGSSATTGFSTSSISAGSAQDAAWRCLVTDTVTGQTAYTGSVSFSLTRNYTALVVTASPSSLSGSSSASPVVTSGSATASVSGGSGDWTGAWEWDGGAASGSINPTTPSNVTTTFQSGDNQAPGTSRGAGFRFNVTDNVTGQNVVSNSVGVNLTRTASGITYADVSPEYQDWPAESPSVVTVGVVHDGVGPFSYSWSADPSLGTTISLPSAASTSVTRDDNTVSITVTCRVIDNGAGGAFIDAVGVINGTGL